MGDHVELVLLSDAMILIDLGYVQGLDVLPQLAQTEVLDVVLEECRHAKQPNLVLDVGRSGIRVVEVENNWWARSAEYQDPRLSPQDRLCIYYARQYGRTLLSNEKPLREICVAGSIPVHGTIWVIEQVHRAGLRPPSQLLNWLTILSENGRWLPESEIRRLRRMLNT